MALPYEEDINKMITDLARQRSSAFFTNIPKDYRPPVDPLQAYQTRNLTKEQLDLEKSKLLAESVPQNVFRSVIDLLKGSTPTPAPQNPSTSKFLERQRILSEATTPIPHVSAGFLAREKREAPLPSITEVLGGGYPVGWEDLPAQTQIQTTQEKPIPTGTTLETLWGIRREGDAYVLPEGQGQMWVGPERFFIGRREVEAGTPGAISGDELARRRLLDLTKGGGIWTGERVIRPEEFAPRTYNVQLPDGTIIQQVERPIPLEETGLRTYEIPKDIQSSIEEIRKVVMKPGKKGGYGKAKLGAIEKMLDTLGGLAMAGATYQARMAEIEAQKKQAEALAEYNRRIASLKEAELPADILYKTALARQAMLETQKPIIVSPGASLLTEKGEWITAPQKQEEISRLIQGAYQRAFTPDPVTGKIPGLPALRKELAHLRLIYPEQLKNLPKEAYKTPKGEFIAKFYEWLETLPKSERKKYKKEDIEKLYQEYWESD